MSNELINFEYKGVPDPDFKLRYISISKYEGDWQSHPCSFSRKMQNVFASFAKTYFKNRKRTF